MAAKTTTKTTTATRAKTTTAVKTEAKTLTKPTDTTSVQDTKEVQEVKKVTTDNITPVETVTEVIEPKVEKVKKNFTDSDYILCRSVCSGGLNVISQSGNLYEFRDYGAECEINYRDLVTLIRRGSEHIFTPRFVILDEDFLEDFPTVKKVYSTMYTRNDLIEILDLPIGQMKAEIAKLPESIKNSMRNLISTQIANGKLDSISKVRELTEIFDSDFNLLSDLFIKR